MNNTSSKRTGNYRRKWNTERIISYIKENDLNVELLSEYEDMYTKMKFRCKCGNIYSTTLHEFTNKKFPKIQCNSCGRKRPNNSNKITCSYIRKYLSDNNYTCKLLSDTFESVDTKLKFQCECGNLFYASWSNIKKMKGYCKQCSFQSVTHDDFINRIRDYLDRFEILNEYQNGDTNISIKCKCCNNIFKQSARHILERGIFCNVCNGSKGEQAISDYLKKNNILYFSQYKFKDCKFINELPFDFYLPKLNTCIEYQGQQHYYPVDFFGGEKTFDIQKKRDGIKKDFCQLHNINFIEISYKNFDSIKEILDNALLLRKGVV